MHIRSIPGGNRTRPARVTENKRADRDPQFASTLQRVMAELNISRVTLARELGIDKSVIGRWLGGANQPTSHNLTRLTDIVRRYRPEVTVDFWRQPLHDEELPLPGQAEHAHRALPADGPVLLGLRAACRPEIDANYLGLWVGFYQSTQNRGSVVLCAMYVHDSPHGLRCVFTEGKVSASGTAIAIGPRLHTILEIEPLHDRLLLFIFNGVGSPDALVMDGLYMISAGDAATCVAASPVVMFRVGDASDFASAGDLAGIMQSLYAVNTRNVQASMTVGDPIAGLTDLAPEQVLRLLCAQVGVQRADGEIDHVLRMPAYRSIPAGNFGLAELPLSSPIVQTRNKLRRALGLDEIG
jgi:transcriptional regulator with XRE-family HTH domain